MLRLRAEKEGRRAALRAEDRIPQGRVGDSALVYDENEDLFRFTNGRFAFSREHTDWARLGRGRMKGL